ncbi:MAG: hypothetical protein IPK81_18405 [Rhodospirillales bacterium]|nr:MAG: hypothetical protein IPK81_18405 [Rhodospirillales bacterium]
MAAIVAADVVGYSRLMGRDEAGTLARLRGHRQARLEPVVARHGGRIVKLTGDGALVEFGSAVDAVSAAVAFQQAMAAANAGQSEDTAIVFRIGVHLGDLIVDGDDLYGDGVNVAARLEAEAPPGGIVVSGDVHNAVAGRLKAVFDDLGDLALKNIDRPVRAFRVDWSAADWPARTGASATAPPSDGAPPPLPDKPSIAVLPFTNMSGDPEQEYFTDGMVEDIITELSRFRSLFVIARNSSFSYKGSSPDIRRVGRELGVRYVLEGSIRRAGDRIRVTGQLIDAPTGNHIWAERYDRVLDDVFAVQVEVTRAIVAAIAPRIDAAEIANALRKRPGHLGAYDLALRAYADVAASYDRTDVELRDRAINTALRALAIDRECGLAQVAIAEAHWQHINFNTAADVGAAWSTGLTAAGRAVEIDPSDHMALRIRGTLRYYAGQRRAGLEDLRLALLRNPNDCGTLNSLAFCEAAFGDARRGVECGELCLRLSPRDRRLGQMQTGLANAYFYGRRYAEGGDVAAAAIREMPDSASGHAILALNLVGLGRIDEAKDALRMVRALAPAYLERRLSGGSHVERVDDRERATVFLRVAAGLEDPSAAEALR